MSSKTETAPVLMAKPEEENQLSPNPAGFGFTKMLFVDSLPVSGELKTLYALKVKKDGEVIGYSYFVWDSQTGFTYAPFAGSVPNMKVADGGRSKPVRTENAPKEAPEKVFYGLVVFQKEPMIKGLPLSEYIDKTGGVTHAELEAAIASVPHVSVTEGTDDDAGFVDTIKIDDNEPLDVVTPSKVVPSIKGADIPDGAVIKVLAVDENGDLVKATAPSGTVTVDGALSDESENPVQNKVITAELEEKADKDGDYPLMSVGEANEANVAESAKQLLSTLYVNDKVPYSLRTSGGSADIGDRLYDKIVGGTLVWNQQVQNGNFESDTGWNHIDITDFSVTNNVCSFTVNAQGQQVTRNLNYINGHKYLGIIDVKLTTGNTNVYLRTVGINRVATQDTTNWQQLVTIFTSPATQPNSFGVRDERASDWDTIQVKNAVCVDLTQMFGSTIADYLAGLSNDGGATWFNNYFKKDIYAYDEGSLQSVQVSSHKMIGFNAYNNVTGKAKLLGGNQYQITGDYTSISYSTGETLTPDVNGKFTPTKDGELTVVGGNATDTCVHLVWSGSRDGEFEPYEENAYTLDSTKVLRGIPKLDVNNKLYYDGDEYLSEGKIIRKYGIRAYQSGDESEPTFRTDMTNTVYPLETFTEETATPFTNPQVVNDFGTEEYVDAGTRDFTMPVGHDTNYLQNLRDKLQRLPDAPTNTGVYVVNYADSVCTYVALSTWLTENNYKVNVIPDAPTTDGDYTLKVSIVDGVATYSWEEI